MHKAIAIFVALTVVVADVDRAAAHERCVQSALSQPAG